MDSALSETANSLVALGKGILAADSSLPTIKKRFEKVGIEDSLENRKIFRELLFTTPEIENYISGVIMFDETIRQSTADGISFPDYLSDRGIIPGIKVDEGKVPDENSPQEFVTKGLEGLEGRPLEYKGLGARFAKWRSVIVISDTLPTEAVIEKNSADLASYAKACQEVGLVPIVEPEVLMDGSHTIDQCRKVTYRTLKSVFLALSAKDVDLSAMLLKPNMVVSGKDTKKDVPSDVAENTFVVMSETVPDTVPGIVFLSGGQLPEQATQNLNEINLRPSKPWMLSFSFERALQDPALIAWGGKEENLTLAQDAFFKRARLNSLATLGEYTKEMEE